MNNKVSQPLFSAHEHALDEPCPLCQHKLEMRFGKHGPFLGCTHYPACDYVRPLQQHDGHVVKELGMPCPDCGEDLLLRQGRFGMFIGCRGWPACRYIASPDKKAEETHLACPLCRGGHLVERQSRYGKTFYACDGYPKCKFAANSRPIKGWCEQCGFALLVEKKTANGVKRQCADRRCGFIQPD
ncbi:topoisomerase DNA-binding C4 zinc finger domain-containing protein [Thaumasiovibrio sp. DFM-14]|uniref:DNA topoisomerase family protein n=1 Tax=Thaumasiovibrio sp. DFM-14 TaxID=3384792 RepID=UPI0039A37603